MPGEGPSQPSGFRLRGVGRRVACVREECGPQQVRALLLGHGVQPLVEHLVGAEPRSQARLMWSQLTWPDLTASSPGRRRIPASSGAAP